MLWSCLLVFDRGVRFDILIRLLSSSATLSDHAVIARDIHWIFSYLFGALILAILLAHVLKWVVSEFGLDRRNGLLSGVFRFKKAPWYYLLSGADFEKNKKPDFIQIAAVVCLGSQSYIYQGVLEFYYPDERGQLDRIVISNASRRLLSDDARPFPARTQALSRDRDVERTGELPRRRKDSPQSRFYPIVGDYFVLHYDEMATLNVRYMKLVDSSPAQSMG